MFIVETLYLSAGYEKLLAYPVWMCAEWDAPSAQYNHRAPAVFR